jgi:hypothetical protein
MPGTRDMPVRETPGGRTSRIPRPSQSLGLAPSVPDVMEWFQEDHGMSPIILGESVQGRNLTAFQWSTSISGHGPSSTSTIEGSPSSVLLFLSLVHGNEPLGLVALLQTAELLISKAPELARQYQHGLQIIFFPIVNIDAYTLNREFGKGCRRTNLATTCTNVGDENFQCPLIVRRGVDLNRNFPVDRNMHAGPNAACNYNYVGVEPFSEPETRAIRDLVLLHRPVAALSFHSRARSTTSLLIHPFTSSRPQILMNREDDLRFRKWSKAMSYQQRDFVTGNAIESIGYTAGGTTIDWLYSINVTGFVLEASAVCNSRWCDTKHSSKVFRSAQRYAHAGLTLTEMVLQQESMYDSAPFPSHFGPWLLLGLFDVAAVILIVLLVRRRRLMRTLKVKTEDTDSIELQSLMI